MIEIELRLDSYNNKYLYIKGTTILHREDGPAVEWFNGNKIWYQHGKVHRLDGPAVEFADGDKEWWIKGINYKTQQEFEKIIKLKAFW